MAIFLFTLRRAGLRRPLRRPLAESSLSWLSATAAGLSLIAGVFFFGLVAFLWREGVPALMKHGPAFFIKADWFYRGGRFDAAAMIYGSVVIAGIALVTAAPVSLGAAVFTSEYLRGPARLIGKGLMELLAGVPSVVYGLLGVMMLRPFVFQAFQAFAPESGDGLLTAGLLVGIMVAPTILSLSDDALRSVPASTREAARALGLTRSEVFFHAVLPRALPGLAAAVLLALGRALGETIAVYLVVGRADNRLPEHLFSLRPWLEAGQTLTSKLGGSEVYLAYGNPEHWQALAGLGVVLFSLVMLFVAVGEVFRWSLRRYQT